MRERSLKIALMCVGVAVAAYAGCSDGGTTTGTTSGDVGGGGGGTPATTTSAMVTSSSTTTTAASTTATSTGAGTSTSGANVDTLGFSCVTDADCGAVLKCVTPAAAVTAFGGGGPANGYCSKDCKTDVDCPGLSGVCFGGSSTKVGLCLLSCELGPELTSPDEELDPNKCNGREDVRCTTLNASGSLLGCRPTCGRDDECPTGRVCDPRAAVCVDKDKANMGFPTGAKCNPMASPPECAGTCVNFGGGITMCSSPCVLGGAIDPADLMAITDCGGLDKGLCAYSPAGNGAGDYGFCGPACKTQGACQNPAFWCSDVGLPNNGYCYGSSACGTGLPACKTPDVCTDTKDGKFCLDPKYPLGTAAPGTSTSSSSAGTGTSSGGSGSGSSTGTGGASSTGSSSATTGASTGTGAGGNPSTSAASTGTN